MPDPSVPRCKDCKFYRPKYQGIGDCARDAGQNSPFWIEPRESGRMMVRDTFSCSEFTPEKAVSNDTL